MKILKKVLCITFFIIYILCDITLAKTGKVNIDATRIREEANTTSNILTVIYEDDEVEILEESGDWCKVKYKNDTGFVKKEFLTISNETQSTTENVNNNTQTSNETQSNAVSNSSSNSEVANNTDSNTNSNNETINTTTETIAEQANLYINSDTFIKVLPNFSSQDIMKFEITKQVQKLSEINNWIQVTDGMYTGWILKVKVQTDAVTVPETPVEETPTTENTNTVSKEPTTNNTNTAENSQENNTTIQSNTTNSETSKKAVITVETANVRKSPSESSERIGTLDYGDEISILGQEGDWYKINIDNQTGYLKNTLLRITEDTVSSRNSVDEREGNTVYDIQNQELAINSKGKDVVGYAKQFLGCKYVVGGKNPNTGFDCSGFTRYIYLNFGYSIGATSSSQTNVGNKIDRENLMPGDLILFLSEDKNGIGHTGIYIGKDEFIHAANPERGVVVDNLNTNSYYNARFAEARRIVD